MRKSVIKSKEEFQKVYVEKSGITDDYYLKHFITMDCNCGECGGFAAVSRNTLSIRTHKKLYQN